MGYSNSKGLQPDSTWGTAKRLVGGLAGDSRQSGRVLHSQLELDSGLQP